MSLQYHDPPGFVDDLTAENKKLWSKRVSAFMRTSRITPELEPQFYDATKVEEKEPKQAVKITWNAFPKNVKLRNPNHRRRWQVADSNRNYQDEYCEWSIKRNDQGKMLRIVFCNEGPEYFKFLGNLQPDTLVDLYKTHNPGFDIQKEDLFDKRGDRFIYNPLNKWNNSTKTGSIMHLIQPANTLGAEVDLAALATVLRKGSNNSLITDPEELCVCGSFGDKDRNSDPHIGSEVNGIARSGAMITIKNPVGLYIDSINWGQITTPDDDDPSKWWKWTRGQEGNYMRAEFEVPADKPYVLGDLLVNGTPLEFGGQLADHMFISLTGWGTDMDGKNQIEPRRCSEAPPNRSFSVKASNISVAISATAPASAPAEEEEPSNRTMGRNIMLEDV